MQIELVKHMFAEYFRECVSNKKIVNSVVEDKVVAVFCQWVKTTYGESAGAIWLETYMKYQFSYWIWYCKQQQIPLVKLRIAWVFGDSARQRFDEKKDKLHWHIPDAYKLKVLNIKPFEPKLVNVGVLKPHEEKEKSLHHNTEACLQWCFENTSMFHPESKFCLTCDKATTCKKIQNKLFPKIAKNRQQNEQTQ